MKGDFPSWSWVGFVGPVWYHPVEDEVDADINLRVGLRDNKSMKWQTFIVAGRLEKLYPLPGHIYLHVRTANVWVMFAELQGKAQYWVQVDRFSKYSFRCSKLNLNWETLPSGRLPFDIHTKILSEPFKCIIMRTPMKAQQPHQERSKAILLWVRSAVRERIGIFDIEPTNTVIDRKGRITKQRYGIGEKFRFRAQKEWIRLS